MCPGTLPVYSASVTSLCVQGVQHLGPATDFYKKLALDCSGQQIGVDLFLLSSQYADFASLCKKVSNLRVCVAGFNQSSDSLSPPPPSLYLQVLGWLRLLLPFLPLHPQSGPVGEVPEGSGALPHQEDRL